jgi:hypothetical protein
MYRTVLLMLIFIYKAIKYKQQFYISLDLSSPDDLLFVFVEKKLMEMLKNIL